MLFQCFHEWAQFSQAKLNLARRAPESIHWSDIWFRKGFLLAYALLLNEIWFGSTLKNHPVSMIVFQSMKYMLTLNCAKQKNAPGFNGNAYAVQPRSEPFTREWSNVLVLVMNSVLF